ncbi:MAG TPA: nitrogen regulation protein NR(I) [Nevskiaceae bacterium]|nr:nitrogen regulation protein NR(I) [Nevskiaceae bacterium]
MTTLLPPAAVWVVDDDASMRFVLERALQRAELAVRMFPGAAELLDALADGSPPRVLVTDIRMPGVDGLQLMERVRGAQPALPVVIITAHSDLDSAVASFKGGAFEYLAKPFDLDDFVAVVRRAMGSIAAAGGSPPAPAPLADSLRRNGLIGTAPVMQTLFRTIGRLAGSAITVLITGESGSGKELVARALHDTSPRTAHPFIAVNTAAIPKDLMESEFFGHERGAFTGANMQRHGRFEQANGGSLFLDEIGDMPAELQTRLLRVLQDGTFYRVGGTTPLAVDVRIIAATNQQLAQRVAEGRFRADLYHRLNVVRIEVPPLRARATDIPALADHFLAAAAREARLPAKHFDGAALARLEAYAWPGNVRELQNLCRAMTVLAPGAEISCADLPVEYQPDGAAAPVLSAATRQAPTDTTWDAALRRWADAELAAGRSDLMPEATQRLERALIVAALVACGGERQVAARRLGVGRNTLTRKIASLGIDA